MTELICMFFSIVFLLSQILILMKIMKIKDLFLFYYSEFRKDMGLDIQNAQKMCLRLVYVLVIGCSILFVLPNPKARMGWIFILSLLILIMNLRILMILKKHKLLLDEQFVYNNSYKHFEMAMISNLTVASVSILLSLVAIFSKTPITSQRRQ